MKGVATLFLFLVQTAGFAFTTLCGLLCAFFLLVAVLGVVENAERPVPQPPKLGELGALAYNPSDHVISALVWAAVAGVMTLGALAVSLGVRRARLLMLAPEMEVIEEASEAPARRPPPAATGVWRPQGA